MDFLQHIDLSDILDIALVAVLIYAALIWFKRTRALLVLVGIVFLGVVFAIARFFNLYLSTAILQGFFAVLLIAILIIFQEELRRFFEHIALWGLRRQPPPPAAPLVEILTRTATDLARQRIGALIVVAGREPVERHVDGGFVLSGMPSEPLLRSIFDPHSAGHDGAVVVADGKVARFACHLPLSTNFAKIPGTGTRHAAALGLAERSDALCIVVSEERGTISLARDGQMEILSSAGELGTRLEAFFAEKFPPAEKHRLLGIFRVNRREKVAAVLLALGLWVIFGQGAGLMQRDFVVPIEYANLPPHLTVDQASPRRLIVTISGDERAFKLLDPEQLKATLDLEKAQPGRQLSVVRKDAVARIPRGLSVESIRPNAVDLTLGAEPKR